MFIRNVFVVLFIVDFFSYKLVRISQNGIRFLKYYCYDIWKLFYVCYSYLYKKKKKEIYCVILVMECVWCLGVEK